MIIIGITGTLGAGKGTIVEHLIEEKGFSHFSVRAYLLNIIHQEGLPENRDSMVLVANRLRAAHSPSYIVEELFKEAMETGKNCIIESIRTPGEAVALKKLGNFYLFSVDADPSTRYIRILKRESETDHINFETFIDNEKREMNSTDPNKQNLQECIRMADYRLHNDGSIPDLIKQLEEIIEKIHI